jgi:thiosulfate reductase cytochrome b subunit
VVHALNIPLLVIMAGSGLQILVAYPYLGPRGRLAWFYPFQGWIPPAWLRIGRWLAGSRHWHFAFAWLLVANGLVYLAYLAASGEWRRRLFQPRRDGGNALATLVYYLRIRRRAPSQGLYNGLQRLAYTAVLVLATIEVLSGLALYKPVQLNFIAVLFGGYEGARATHLFVLAMLAGFTFVHIVMVLLHPRSLRDIVTGGRSDA